MMKTSGFSTGIVLPGDSKKLEITFRVKTEVLMSLLYTKDSVKNNFAEIGKYKTTYGYTYFDLNSDVNNENIVYSEGEYAGLTDLYLIPENLFTPRINTVQYRDGATETIYVNYNEKFNILIMLVIMYIRK